MVKKAKKRVIVGMSGGVDSTMAAALLKKQGYDVVGVFMDLWKEKGHKKDGLRDRKDAEEIAKILKIPFYFINASKEFRKEVVGYFLDEIGNGRTPNPCVVCNERIKFNFLFKKMLEMDADFVATGHYAEIVDSKGEYRLKIPRDNEKDQTYFLYNLKQEQLKKIIFPIGKYEKAEIKKMAKKMKLPVFEKDESQNICFIHEKTPNEFIKRNLKLSHGDIVTTDGSKIGTHEGLELYTIGQRKGINIGGNGPYYVVDRNFKNNQLIVTNNENDPAICRKSMLVEVKNWVSDEPKMPMEINVKIRYRHPLVRGIIHPVKSLHGRVVEGKFNRVKSRKNNVYMIEFNQPQKAVTPGQSAVFYSDKNEVLGGGIIT